jgi:SagB-type dehydrogenase family enzyme
MQIPWLSRVALAMLLVFSVCSLSRAAELAPPSLPKPQMEGGKPLMQALKERASLRTFSTEKLPAQILSNLLWASCGINRPDTGKRTAPSARNWQEIEVYVATADGLFLFEPKEHVLKPILPEDIRALTGTQPFVKDVPVNLIYVADYSKTSQDTPADKDLYVAADAGFISQNVYLYCASEGLATVVRGLIDRDTLAKKMGLRSDQKIILAQSVGYPKK